MPDNPAPRTGGVSDDRPHVEIINGFHRTCSCPKRRGNIYHERGTCTDPLVAAFEWYGTPPAGE